MRSLPQRQCVLYPWLWWENAEFSCFEEASQTQVWRGFVCNVQQLDGLFCLCLVVEGIHSAALWRHQDILVCLKTRKRGNGKGRSVMKMPEDWVLILNQDYSAVWIYISWSIKIGLEQSRFKGIVLSEKNEILSSFTHFDVILNLYDLLSSVEHKRRYFEGCSGCSFQKGHKRALCGKQIHAVLVLFACYYNIFLNWISLYILYFHFSF